ncbi:hypothetical protein V8E36_000387 [Tilletia maclaganii]
MATPAGTWQPLEAAKEYVDVGVAERALHAALAEKASCPSTSTNKPAQPATSENKGKQRKRRKKKGKAATAGDSSPETADASKTPLQAQQQQPLAVSNRARRRSKKGQRAEPVVKTPKVEPSILNLPNEVLVHIIRLLETPWKAVLAQTHPLFRRLILNEGLLHRNILANRNDLPAFWSDGAIPRLFKLNKRKTFALLQTDEDHFEAVAAKSPDFGDRSIVPFLTSILLAWWHSIRCHACLCVSQPSSDKFEFDSEWSVVAGQPDRKLCKRCREGIELELIRASEVPLVLPISVKRLRTYTHVGKEYIPHLKGYFYPVGMLEDKLKEDVERRQGGILMKAWKRQRFAEGMLSNPRRRAKIIAQTYATALKRKQPYGSATPRKMALVKATVAKQVASKERKTKAFGKALVKSVQGPNPTNSRIIKLFEIRNDIQEQAQEDPWWQEPVSDIPGGPWTSYTAPAKVQSAQDQVPGSTSAEGAALTAPGATISTGQSSAHLDKGNKRLRDADEGGDRDAHESSKRSRPNPTTPTPAPAPPLRPTPLPDSADNKRTWTSDRYAGLPLTGRSKSARKKLKAKLRRVEEDAARNAALLEMQNAEGGADTASQKEQMLQGARDAAGRAVRAMKVDRVGVARVPRELVERVRADRVRAANARLAPKTTTRTTTSTAVVVAATAASSASASTLDATPSTDSRSAYAQAAPRPEVSASASSTSAQKRKANDEKEASSKRSKAT